MLFTQYNYMKRLSIIILFVIMCSTSIFTVIIPPTQSIIRTSSNTKNQSNDETNTSKKTYALYKDNWFDFVNEFWQRYTTAEVIDVQTLTRYKVMRVGGYNHADVEPLTAEETNKMYSIYNYEWSWTRRPVWVYVNDRYIAASINGYPHAYDLVEGNNMTGHTCIHFYKSRTHASNNWDPAHRAAVEEAYGSQEKFEEYIKNYHK